MISDIRFCSVKHYTVRYRVALIAASCLAVVCNPACTGDSGESTTASDAGSQQGSGTGSGPDATAPVPGGGTVVLPDAHRARFGTAAAVTSSSERLVAFFDKSHGELRLARKGSDGSWRESTGAASEYRVKGRRGASVLVDSSEVEVDAPAVHPEFE